MAPRPGALKARATNNAEAGPSAGPGGRKRKRRPNVAPVESMSALESAGRHGRIFNVPDILYPDVLYLQQLLAGENLVLNFECQRHLQPETRNYPKPLVEGPLPLNAAEQDAEDFDIDRERELFSNAQHEAFLAAEADEIQLREDQYEDHLVNLADFKDIQGHHLKSVLQKGADYHITGIPPTATYDELVSLQYSAEQLAKMCCSAKQALVDAERLRMIQVEDTLKRKIEETSALATLQAAEMHELQETMEEHRNRVICTICYSNVRDSLLLPCMHFQFCSSCIARHLQERKTCPICRTPVSGTLQTKLD